jgi:hypothetical protein
MGHSLLWADILFLGTDGMAAISCLGVLHLTGGGTDRRDLGD